MSGARRLPQGGRIRRDQPVTAFYNGQPLAGFAGDAVASALLAAGEQIVARSFKYHRPRGLLTAGIEEPNALMTIGQGSQAEPNIAATTVELAQGLQVATQNAWPSVKWDWRAVNSLASPLFAAGFYYKTFMGPVKGTAAWMFFEHHIRKAAGLGQSNELPDSERYDWQHDFVDVLVIGSGVAGLTAALAASHSGLDVLLVEQDFELGGALLNQPKDSAWGAWLEQTRAQLLQRSNVRCLTRASAFGLYDGNTIGVIERAAAGQHNPTFGQPKQVMRVVRFGSVVMACGAIERPLVFVGNDHPGVMMASAIGSYIHRYGVLPGQQMVFGVNNDAAYQDAITAAQAGARVLLADARSQVDPTTLQAAKAAGIEVRCAAVLSSAKGSRVVKQVRLSAYDHTSQQVGATLTWANTDLVAMSGGYGPTVHPSTHCGIKPVYRDDLASFVPGGFATGHWGAGAMVGATDWAAAYASGWQAGAAAAQHLQPSWVSPPMAVAPGTAAGSMLSAALPALRPAGERGKAFIDFQHDVHLDDVALAHREGFVSVEHLKRYTTMGMATDQGKTSNQNALMAMAALRGLSVPATGTTTFRPPFTPVTIGALAGRGVRSHYRPVRRTAMHDWHLANQGQMTEAGYWMRPLWYASHGANLTEAYRAEMLLVRRGVGLADVSTLGKIDVQGPDAAAFLDRVYVNGFSKLPVGKARYGFMLREDGIALDDGTTSRLSETRFFMTTTTGQAARVMSHLEFLLQVVWPELRVTVASSSDQWAAMSMAGPKVRELLRQALPQIDFATDVLPHMGVVESVGVGPLAGVPMRVMRLTFSGELAYEIYVPTHFGQAMWNHLFEVGKAFDLHPYGLEALASLRIEKGHVVGSEMDGRTTLNDLGAGAMASKLKPFWGDALRRSENLAREDRPTLVGLQVIQTGGTVSNGAILFFENDEIKGVGRGHVSSNCWSEEVGATIALGFLQGGKTHIGKEVIAASPVQNRQTRLRVVDPCFIDAEGARYRV